MLTVKDSKGNELKEGDFFKHNDMISKVIIIISKIIDGEMYCKVSFMKKGRLGIDEHQFTRIKGEPAIYKVKGIKLTHEELIIEEL